MKKFRVISIILFIASLLINIVSSKFPLAVEKYYSTGINIYMVKFLSKINSILPFSLFEILIYIIVLWILIYLIYTTFKIIKDYKKTVIYLKDFILNIISVGCLIYFLFVILWGLNYNRLDLKTSLILDYNKTYNSNIKEVDYGKDELQKLYEFLIEKCNENRLKVKEDKEKIMVCNGDYKDVINRGTKAYENVSILDLNKRGLYGKAKPILNSNLLCYTNITGIYSPFTGEPNINIAVPSYYMPFTTLHEMAHQRGYASEDEANFLAYIACINNEDYDFKYSGYLLALKYVSSALARIDYENLVRLNSKISSKVIDDLTFSNEFWKKYEGQISKTSENINNSYLKANGVDEGTASYGKIVNLLLTYYELYDLK